MCERQSKLAMSNSGTVAMVNCLWPTLRCLLQSGVFGSALRASCRSARCRSQRYVDFPRFRERLTRPSIGAEVCDGIEQLGGPT